jgi:hypothetical protein
VKAFKNGNDALRVAMEACQQGEGRRTIAEPLRARLLAAQSKHEPV